VATILITGCDTGLGVEFARQYAADGHRVIATCIDPSSAKRHGGYADHRYERILKRINHRRYSWNTHVHILMRAGVMLLLAVTICTGATPWHRSAPIFGRQAVNQLAQANFLTTATGGGKVVSGNPTGHGVIFLSSSDTVFCYVATGEQPDPG
jgi:NAD(P)-dependent dehydrogenase (short-subunit alcohol dehydrogenase family)